MQKDFFLSKVHGTESKCNGQKEVKTFRDHADDGADHGNDGFAYGLVVDGDGLDKERRT